jgi:hypothetical protein
MGHSVRRISMSLKMLLGFLFVVLLFTECLDGFHDISDWAVSLFTIIMLNDIYIHLKLFKGEKSEYWNLSERNESTLDKNKRKLIYGFNFIFIAMILGSVLIEFFVLSQGMKDAIYKMAVIIWSGAFLTSNLIHLREKFRISRLVVTNVALMFLLGSLTLI